MNVLKEYLYIINKIKDKVIELDWDYKRLSVESGVCLPSIYNTLGNYSTPRIDNLLKLIKALDLELEIR